MTDLFLDVLNASYAASFVVLAVILARLLLKKAPRWVFCLRWGYAVLRLMFPLQIETEKASIERATLIASNEMMSIFEAMSQ